ncbi:uncharacterized protein [Watersipora subatra]|uniref:uncharacterized protein isoform X2 n=1 Tax=Watersipora subatra TaxID=2589382 RepID=UPI00355C8FA5
MGSESSKTPEQKYTPSSSSSEPKPKPQSKEEVKPIQEASKPLEGSAASVPAATLSTEPAETTKKPAMAMAGLEEQLREMLECKICFEDKEKQKLLPCQHTICLDCLNRLEVKQSKYKCPLCNREMLVPNGGFEALQESLITKQLAHLIKPRPASAAGQPATRPRVSVPATSSDPPASIAVAEIQKKLSDSIEKGTLTLGQSEVKIKSCASMLDDLEETAKRMKTSINNLMSETIDKLMANASKKVSAIDDLTQKKRDELFAVICKLQDANAKAKRGIDLMRSRVSSPRQTIKQILVGEEMQNTQTSLKDLEDLLSNLDAVGGSFRAGDSVRLRMADSLLTSEFLLSDLNHYSIGFIHQVDDDGDCAVIFPENSRWTGNISSLEKSATKHNLPVIGDRVKVKDSVTSPHFKWGLVKPGSIGILTELKNSGPSKGRQVEVDFPEDHDWSALYDELERIPPEPLKVGEEVWMGAKVTEPARGWAGVTPTSVGTLMSVNDGEVEVNFPECNNWKGLLEEIERTRPITVGDKVKVKRSITEPKFAWGGVDHDDVGKVAKIMNSSEHGQVVKVDFPNRLGLWQCLMSEIEIVSRHTGGEPTTRQRRSSDVQCPTQ